MPAARAARPILVVVCVMAVLHWRAPIAGVAGFSPIRVVTLVLLGHAASVSFGAAC